MNEAHQPPQRYRVIERLAAGGMAEVFVAESAGIEGFKKQVAIKRVLPALSGKKRFIAMFLDEARLSAHLTHSNVAQVFDIGVGDNAYFIVMEYVDGADLKAVLEYVHRAGRTLSPEHAAYIAAKICEGLAYAHEREGEDGKPLHIIHRDVSPPNVLITKHGEVKIVDFGLAKATSQLEKSEAGMVKGKFGYLSPEAAEGLAIDHRTDLFAVGILLWEMLAGRRLFLGETDFETVKQVRDAQIPDLRGANPNVPDELDRIIRRALAKDPAARYASARDLGKDLTAWLFRHGRPVTAWDIAELVRASVAQKKRAAPEKSSIIDKLIDEALLEFTSLQDEKAEPAEPLPDTPLQIGFEDIGHWADELAAPASAVAKPRPASAPPSPPSAPPPRSGAENVAALEARDDQPPAIELAPAPAAKNTTLILAVVGVVLVALAGAWFTFAGR